MTEIERKGTSVRAVTMCCGCFLLVFLISCDEALPPRQDPSQLFKVQVQPFYIYTSFQNDVVVNLVATNEFDETLNDRVGIGGTFEITSTRDTSVHKTFRLSTSNLTGGKYDPNKGTLTIDPGTSAVLQVAWDFTDDAGRDLTTGFFQYSIDRTCAQRNVSNLETFTLTANIKLFSNLGYAQAQTQYSIRQYSVFVGPRDCTPL